MVDQKLFLIACVHASNGDYRKLSKIYSKFQGSQEFINAVVVLWPELDDPLNLKFLFKADSDETDIGTNDNDLIVFEVASYPSFLSIVEMDENTVHQRYEEIQQYVNHKLNILGLSGTKFNWFQKRVIICNEISSKATLTYKPLWDIIKGQDESIDQWINGIVKPLAHYNERLHTEIKIRDFEKVVSNESQMSEWFNADDSAILENELIPFLKYNKLFYKSFLNDKYNGNNFKITDIPQYHRLQKLFQTFIQEFKDDQTEIEMKTLEIIFENSNNLTSFISLREIEADFLNKIDDNIELTNYSIKNKDVKMYCEVVEQYSSVSNYSLLELYGITQEDKDAQFSHFTSLCERVLDKDESHLERLLNPIPIFDKVKVDEAEDKNKIITTLMETTLQLEKYPLIPRIFSLTSENSHLLTILVNTFWQYFHNANGMNTIEMSNAEKVLKYVKQYDITHKYANRLSQLISLCHDLFLSKLWKFQRNDSKKRTQPSQILEFHNSPIEIIRILMELNPNFYQNDIRQVTWSLWERILISLQCPEKETDYMDLLSLHIDYSLVYNDFIYASKHIDRLLQDEVNGKRHWLTIFQVGKYRSFENDNINLDMITLQMNILSRLLRVCPVEEVEIVTNQWNALSLQIQQIDLNADVKINNKDDSISKLLTSFV